MVYGDSELLAELAVVLGVESIGSKYADKNFKVIQILQICLWKG